MGMYVCTSHVGLLVMDPVHDDGHGHESQACMGTHVRTSHVGLLVRDPFHHDGHGHGGMYVCMWRPRVQQQQTRLGFEHSLIRLASDRASSSPGSSAAS
jgi:hypothetical protein